MLERNLFIWIFDIGSCTAEHFKHIRDRTKGLTDEARFKGMEEERQTALEVAQEEDAPTEESAQAAEAVGLIPFIWWEHGVVRYPCGLQLLSL